MSFVLQSLVHEEVAPRDALEEAPPKAEKFQCKFCNKSFPEKTAFLLQTQRYAKEQHFKCDIYSMVFVEKELIESLKRGHI